MFIGHFGLGFAAKRVEPRMSLGTAFLAAQFLDLLWPTLLLLGMETVRVAPGATAVTPLVFEHYPISHSLLGAVGWGVLVAILHALARRNARAAVLVGALVVSHWLLDAIVHVPDLPLLPSGHTMVGLGLWQSKAASLAVEVPVFALGVWLYARSTRAIDRTGRYALVGLVAFLAVVHAGNVFGAPPPGPTAIAWVGQAQWLLVAWAYWVDGHRQAMPGATPAARADSATA